MEDLNLNPAELQFARQLRDQLEEAEQRRAKEQRKREAEERHFRVGTCRGGLARRWNVNVGYGDPWGVQTSVKVSCGT